MCAVVKPPFSLFTYMHFLTLLTPVAGEQRTASTA